MYVISYLISLTPPPSRRLPHCLRPATMTRPPCPTMLPRRPGPRGPPLPPPRPPLTKATHAPMRSVLLCLRLVVLQLAVEVEGTQTCPESHLFALLWDLSILNIMRARSNSETDDVLLRHIFLIVLSARQGINSVAIATLFISQI